VRTISIMILKTGEDIAKLPINCSEFSLIVFNYQYQTKPNLFINM
jgi:hypothetical protein